MSALQALTIYILLATLDEDNISRSSNVKVIHVMMVSSPHSSLELSLTLVQAVAAKIEGWNFTYDTTQHGEWQRWALQESRDR